jgi:3-hydroxyacyl-CoA dehydrogenase / enoyl-CoA hydratase / 3-hydroxybutyryl-CoA epimerase
MEIRAIGVVGGGTMGAGIIQTVSRFGFPVFFVDVNEMLLQKCLDQVRSIYASGLKKKKWTAEDMARGLSLIHGRTEYDGFDSVNLIIEAVPEDMGIKRAIFRNLDTICKSEAVFASNTSALSISELAGTTRRPLKFIGMHWFNPPQVMRLIEVIPGLETSEATVETIMAFCRTVGKVPVRLKECAGFLVNRLLGMYVNEGFWMLEEGYLPADIDQAGVDMGMPMGPFTLGDMSGWDVVHHSNRTIFETYGTRFKIPRRFEELISSKKFGVKTEEGIYKYEKDESGRPRTMGNDPSSLNEEERKILSNRFLWTTINEGIRCLDEGIANEADIDRALQLGAGMPKGPLSWADEIGLDWILNELDTRKEKLGERYWPSPLLRRKVKAGHFGKKVKKGFFNYAS